MPNGAQALLRTLVDAGVTTCFTNPGTSEMHFVAALDSVPKMRAVLALFEGVATGGADGYARMADRPGATLLHLGSGLGNGLANLHNARKGRTPIVNIVGDHATYHTKYDAQLQSDIETSARNVSSWVRTSQSTEALPGDAADALREGGERMAILLGGRALREPGLLAAARVAAVTGAKLYAEVFPQRIERGAGLPHVERIAYLAELAGVQLAGLKHLVLVDAKAPVSFFAYPGKKSYLVPDKCEVHELASPSDDALGSLEALVEALGAGGAQPALQEPVRPARPTGA